jgi:ABC-type phosphate/phosphonate transport system ATPase subunit
MGHQEHSPVAVVMIEVRIEVTDEHVSCVGHPSTAEKIWQAIEQIKQEDDSTVITVVMVMKGHIYDIRGPAW